MKYVQPIGGLADDPYLDANPVGGIEGSPVPAAAIEHPMRELVALITDAGLVPNEAVLTQIATAVRTLIQKQAPVVAAAAGTADAITAAYDPVVAALTNGMTLRVRPSAANATTTPTFTPAAGTIAAKTIVKGNNLALVAGDIAGAGHWVSLQYDLTLDRWVLLNPAKGVFSTAVARRGSAANLKGSAPGNSAVVTYTADEIVTGDDAGNYQSSRNWNTTITMTAAGPGGLDTGVVAANTWYNAFAITKDDGTKAALASLSATAPTLSAGYTKWARLGAFRTDNTASKFPLGFTQRGRYTTLLIGSANVPAAPLMASGAAGVFNNSTFTGVAVAWANYAPPTAAKLRVGMSANNTATVVGVASNANRTGYATANPPELGYDSNAYPLVTYGDLQLETSNIYWASQGSGTGYLLSGGWEDNL